MLAALAQRFSEGLPLKIVHDATAKTVIAAIYTTHVKNNPSSSFRGDRE